MHLHADDDGLHAFASERPPQESRRWRPWRAPAHAGLVLPIVTALAVAETIALSWMGLYASGALARSAGTVVMGSRPTGVDVPVDRPTVVLRPGRTESLHIVLARPVARRGRLQLPPAPGTIALTEQSPTHLNPNPEEDVDAP